MLLLARDSQRLLDRQLSYRDKALAEDSTSGMPPEFEQWCKTSWLPANLGRAYYRRQQRPTSRTYPSALQKEIEERAGNLLDERDRMIQQRLWLQNELDNVGAADDYSISQSESSSQTRSLPLLRLRFFGLAGSKSKGGGVNTNGKTGSACGLS